MVVAILCCVDAFLGLQAVRVGGKCRAVLRESILEAMKDLRLGGIFMF